MITLKITGIAAVALLLAGFSLTCSGFDLPSILGTASSGGNESCTAEGACKASCLSNGNCNESGICPQNCSDQNCTLNESCAQNCSEPCETGRGCPLIQDKPTRCKR